VIPDPRKIINVKMFLFLKLGVKDMMILNENIRKIIGVIE
tara:strand:+ start:1163 stop:1282 length:120 start_codon:yes stop_codon:yes gene_type:complete